MKVNGGRNPLGLLSTDSDVFRKTGVAERWGGLLGKEWRYGRSSGLWVRSGCDVKERGINISADKPEWKVELRWLRKHSIRVQVWLSTLVVIGWLVYCNCTVGNPGLNFECSARSTRPEQTSHGNQTADAERGHAKTNRRQLHILI